MRLLAYELRLLMRQKLTVTALALLALLTIAALAAGGGEVARQRAAIAAIPAAQADDSGAIAAWVAKEKDAGSAAYYSFHPTWDAPSPLAFAALGMRDVSPYIMRVRALGLEAQIYDGDTFNPELALPGRFDFAFVLVCLAPLFVIALFHDLLAGEREAQRGFRPSAEVPRCTSPLTVTKSPLTCSGRRSGRGLCRGLSTLHPLLEALYQMSTGLLAEQARDNAHILPLGMGPAWS